MCIQFNAVKLLVTTAPAQMTNHDGSVTVNEDCPVGTVLCYDKAGHLYYCADPNIAFIFQDRARTRSFASRRKPIRLYRDYWKHIASGPDTPYGAAFRNAEHVVVEEQI